MNVITWLIQTLVTPFTTTDTACSVIATIIPENMIPNQAINIASTLDIFRTGRMSP